ncbi:phytanoyl-CoA dioxygenase family protein [Chromohalobacter israelensis]|uniref:phytanoyl-CoA dioxygenase family protein n=1 Tax=Chromohalobacter israelensis TaxID=141390 RepID=UPI000FFF6092|nr:phytanoyl-CoA dioxygenase family protein [Chromohalobacter salexigens]RXE48150.1 hypothetical protein B4O83_09240 [Chromohalobacter salexigens]
MRELINHTKAILATAWMHFFASKGELQPLLNDTVKIIPDFLPPSVCNELINRIDQIANTDKHPKVWHDTESSDTRIWGFESEIEDLLHYFEIGRWIRAVDDYSGLKTKSWCLMANRLVPKSMNLGSGGGMHRDSPFSHQVKCIWYLNDVGTENGPFQYLHATHTNIIRDKSLYPLGKSRYHGTDFAAQEVHGKAGTLIICDTKCIHGGKPIEAGSRYAITLYTFSKKDGVKRTFEKLGLSSDLV